MNPDNVEINPEINTKTITVSAETVETEPSPSLKEQFATHLDQAKAETKTRAQRIREIFQAAFVEALSEVKGGSGQVWKISKDSIATVLEIEIPEVKTSAAEPSEPKLSGPDETVEADSTVGVGINNVEANAEVNAKPKSSVAQPFWQTVLNSLKAKAQVSLKQEYERLPDRLSPLKEKAARWDEKLGEKYGDRYTSTKQTSQKATTQILAKATDWYRKAKQNSETLKSTPLDRQQIEIEVVVTKAGEKLAQKEDQIKQQLKDAVKSVLNVR